MNERQRVHADGASASEPGGDGVRGRSPRAAMNGVLLEVRGLVKHYGATHALTGVDLVVHEGEVHCVVGQNGAGKSTLIRCISGVETPTSGSIAMDDVALAPGDPTAAFRAGVAAIYQELDLVDSLTVAENLFLGHEPSRFGFVSRRAARQEARRVLERLGHRDIDPGALVGTLRPAAKQIVSIGRALSRDARLLIMDEPSAVFDKREVETLFRIVERLRDEGVGIIYISHRLEEVARIGDTVTVLRDGATIASGLPRSVTADELIEHMVGRRIANAQSARTASAAERSTDTPVLSVRGLNRAPDVFAIDVDVLPGEIVGIGGLVGSGRTEVLRAIYGVDRRDSGTVVVDGVPLPAGRPDRAVAVGLAFAPEERKSQALWRDWSLTRNTTIAHLRVFRSWPRLRVGAERAAAHEQLRALGTRPDDPDRLASQLSGGNQQKVVLARWLLRDCKVLLLDEPTRGVDVGAKEEIYRLITDLATRGIGVLIVSSELSEIERLCQRALVMRDGHVVAELEGVDVTESNIVRLGIAAPSLVGGPS